MGSPELNYVTGDGIENRHEVLVVKRELAKTGIFLEGFGITITGVYTKPRPYGFDFDCKQPRSLLELARGKAAFSEDNRDTKEGAFSAGQTQGEGFRQIGTGPRLHLEIAMDGKCNVHIDSHGYVVGKGQYDWNRGLEHGYWDLLSDKAPGLFGSFGDQGQVGPMIRPVVSLDGRTRWVIGLTGHWQAILLMWAGPSWEPRQTALELSLLLGVGWNVLNHYRLPAISNGGYEGLVVTTDPFLEPYTARIIALASERRLPAIYPFSVAVEQGGLMSYSADLFVMWRRAASYVDRILKGERPGDLPIEQPTAVTLKINLKTAKALGLNAPPSLLSTADEVIE